MQEITSINEIHIAASGNQFDGKSDRWAKAMARYRAAQAALEPFEERQDLAEDAARAAKRALDEIAMPDCMTIEVATEIYFSDGLRDPTHKLGTQQVKLQDEETICAYAKDDTMLRDRLLAELKVWRRGRRKLEAAATKAEAASEAANSAYSDAIYRMDMALLRVLRTPVPTGDEMRWKIETLLKRAFSDDVEDAGWTYVGPEICRLTKPKGKSRQTLN